MDSKRTVALPKDSRKQNLRELLRVICAKKIFTIAELSEATSISRQTVAKAISCFMDEEIITVGEKSESTEVGGRRANTFSLNPEKYVLIVMLYSKKLHFALLNLACEVIDEYNEISPVNMPYNDFLQMVKKATDFLLSKNGLTVAELFGIMMGVGGIVNEDLGIVNCSTMWGTRVNIPKDIQEVLQSPDYVNIANIAKIGASGITMDSDSTQKRVIVIYIDYGVGVTMLDDWRIPQTRNSITGELGHMVLKYDSEAVCDVNDRGCFESLIAEKHLLELASELPEDQRLSLMEGYTQDEDFRVLLLRKAEAGHKGAKRLTDYLAEVFGAALRNLEFCFDPDCYIIQGSFTGWTQSFIQQVKDVVRRNNYLKNIDFEVVSAKKSIERTLEEGGIFLMLQRYLDRKM